MNPTADEVQHLARLSRVGVDAEEADAHARDLQATLTMLEALDTVDTAAVEPLVHAVTGGARLRPDEVTAGDQRELFQAGAPATADGVYLVPRVVE